MTEFFNFWEKEEAVHIPVESGERFAPTGFIGPISAKALYQMYCTLDFNDPTFEAPPPFHGRKTTNGYFYYYEAQEDALKAREIAQEKNFPTLMWTFQIETAQVMNTLNVKKLQDGKGDGKSQGFGPIISLSAQYDGLS